MVRWPGAWRWSRARGRRAGSASRRRGCSAERGAAVAVTSTTERDPRARGGAGGATASRRPAFIADLTELRPGRGAGGGGGGAVRAGSTCWSTTPASPRWASRARRCRSSRSTEAQWDRDIAVNLKTAFNVTRAVLPGMVERGYGRVVNVSSVTGPRRQLSGQRRLQRAARARWTGSTRALAIETGPHGVTVNSVAPGWIETGSSIDGELEGGRNTPVGRPGTPDEVAELIAFLAVGRRPLPDRPVDRRRRRQHDPGVQGRLGGTGRRWRRRARRSPAARGQTPTPPPGVFGADSAHVVTRDVCCELDG